MRDRERERERVRERTRDGVTESDREEYIKAEKRGREREREREPEFTIGYRSFSGYGSSVNMDLRVLADEDLDLVIDCEMGRDSGLPSAAGELALIVGTDRS